MLFIFANTLIIPIIPTHKFSYFTLFFFVLRNYLIVHNLAGQ